MGCRMTNAGMPYVGNRLVSPQFWAAAAFTSAWYGENHAGPVGVMPFQLITVEMPLISKCIPF